MQGPAGACLREPIDFLDNLDGPNPLMMGKQKYCFLEHFWRTANKYERKRSTQHGDATKVGHAISAASNPAVQRLMDADPSLTASAAVTKVGHAISAASNLARHSTSRRAAPSWRLALATHLPGAHLHGAARALESPP
jgi:hypothetical protein